MAGPHPARPESPRMTGEDLKSISVVILTTSEAEPDINKSFSLCASSYLTKPIDVQRLSMVVQSVQAA